MRWAETLEDLLASNATPGTETHGGRSAADLLLDPDRLMRPERLGALAPSRMSASRSLVNKMITEKWSVELASLDIDASARGRAIYRICAGAWTFSFVAYSFEPVLEGRTGRIIGQNWDMAGSLVEGEISDADVETTAVELPKLYAGRATPGTLVWCRSNRSLRLFDHVVDRLADGVQPDLDELWGVGYLMRNTGLDGNGTFGTRSFLALEADHPLRVPYHAQMLAAYLMREFSVDLVEHMARLRNPGAPRLAPELRRCLGLGNGSALGLVFFTNTHPVLIDRWLSLRQRAMVRAAGLPLDDGRGYGDHLAGVLARALRFYAEDPFTYLAFEDPGCITSDLQCALDDLARLRTDVPTAVAGDLLSRLDGVVSAEAWEVVAAALLELIPDQVDELTADAAVHEILQGAPGATVAQMRTLLSTEYAWALRIDMDAPGARAYVWYKSRDAEEPRRGPADEVPDGRNWALDLPGDLQRLDRALAGAPAGETMARFLATRPELRGIAERAQGLGGTLYHSPHMNMLDEAFRPVHIVRFMNAAFHGLDRTVDSQDRNVLGLLFQGAPTRDELESAQEWAYPAKPAGKAKGTAQ
ncbi:hypothetical protein [Specibacter cremeus]|uniref:hypothetical protein n=1 Tax=Specibacter cremeus TaxID=1629051 RepID=UPI000F77E5B0|nr:hypothetical protein [Specibacter cremeus]